MLDHVGISLDIASLPHMDYLGLNEGLVSKNKYYFDTRIHFWGVESMPMCLNLGRKNDSQTFFCSDCKREHDHARWCPQKTLYLLVYKPHEYYRNITNKNHSYWSYVHQLNAIVAGGTTLWDMEVS